jgi:hypothetical protein
MFADDGLAAPVNVNVLNGDLLLALPRLSVQGFQQCGEMWRTPCPAPSI